MLLSAKFYSVKNKFKNIYLQIKTRTVSKCIMFNTVKQIDFLFLPIKFVTIYIIPGYMKAFLPNDKFILVQVPMTWDLPI